MTRRPAKRRRRHHLRVRHVVGEAVEQPVRVHVADPGEDQHADPGSQHAHRQRGDDQHRQQHVERDDALQGLRARTRLAVAVCAKAAAISSRRESIPPSCADARRRMLPPSRAELLPRSRFRPIANPFRRRRAAMRGTVPISLQRHVHGTAASASTSPGATSKPMSSEVTNSGTPPTRDATTGVPHARASRTTLGLPSRKVGRTSRSAARYHCGRRS